MAAPSGAPWAIRPRDPGDLPALADVLARQQAASQYPVVWPLPVPVEDFIVRPREERAWIGELGGRPAGHVSVLGVVDDRDGMGACWSEATGVALADLAELAVLFVDGEARDVGLGGALLDVAVSWIRDEGRIPVLDVAHVHGAAMDLYRRRGWQVVGHLALEWLPVPLTLMVLPPDAEASDDDAS